MCRDLENAGASFSATSDREKIVYSVSCLADKVDEVVGVIAEAIIKPVGENKFYVLEETAKDTEKVIMDARSSDPRAQVGDLLLEAAYGENTAMGKPEYAPNLKHLAAGEVMAFRDTHYKTGNLIVSASGVPHDTLKSLVDCYFYGMPEGKPTTTAATYSGGDMKVRTDLAGETYMAVGFPAPAGAASTLLAAKLEDSVAKLGVKKGMLSTVSGNGIIGFLAHGDAAAATKAIEAAVGALKALSTDAGVSDGDKAKATLSNFLTLEEKTAQEPYWRPPSLGWIQQLTPTCVMSAQLMLVRAPRLLWLECPLCRVWCHSWHTLLLHRVENVQIGDRRLFL